MIGSVVEAMKAMVMGEDHAMARYAAPVTVHPPVVFHIGLRLQHRVLEFLWPGVKRLPRPVAQAVLAVALFPSRVVWYDEGGRRHTTWGWRLDNEGNMYLAQPR